MECFFNKTVSESSCDIDKGLTIVVEEDGRMVLDITKTLFNFTEQNGKDSLVIVTTDETGVLNSSSVTYFVQEDSKNASSSSQAEILDDSHSFSASCQDATSVPLPAINNEVEYFFPY